MCFWIGVVHGNYNNTTIGEYLSSATMSSRLTIADRDYTYIFQLYPELNDSLLIQNHLIPTDNESLFALWFNMKASDWFHLTVDGLNYSNTWLHPVRGYNLYMELYQSTGLTSFRYCVPFIYPAVIDLFCHIYDLKTAAFYKKYNKGLRNMYLHITSFSMIAAWAILMYVLGITGKLCYLHFT